VRLRLVTRAAFAGDVCAPAQYGPRIRALVVYLVAYQHLPYDRAARLLADWLGAPLSTGTLHTIVEQAGGGLDVFCERVLERCSTALSCMSMRPGRAPPAGCAGCTPRRPTR